jgi:hypothetical protein
LFTFITIHYTPACSPQLCHSLWPITPITLTYIIYRFVWYGYSSWTTWTLKMEATNSSKSVVVGTNQNIVISRKTLIFINTTVWTSDLPKKLILSIKHTYRETICCHNDWRYWQQFSWLLYSGIWCNVSWYSSTLQTEKALPLKCWYQSTKLHDMVHRCGWWQDAIIAWCQISHIYLTLGCLFHGEPVPNC